jgi:hypothetical protein
MNGVEKDKFNLAGRKDSKRTNDPQSTATLKLLCSEGMASALANGELIDRALRRIVQCGPAKGLFYVFLLLLIN